MSSGLICREDGKLHYPPLLQNKTPSEYRSFFESIYCRAPVKTFDGIEVRFRKRDFNHCFFESLHSIDDTFSSARAERLLWIRAALQDKNSIRYVGWNKKKRRYDRNRRVTLVKDNYVVVIAITGEQKADFITAYVVDNPESLKKIKNSPLWA